MAESGSAEERSGCRSGRGLAGLLAVFEAVAVAVELEDVDVMGQPVEQRAGEAFGPEDLGPFEIPFVLRILKDQFPFSDLISKVLSLDYLGGLVASLLFPLWLVPQVGLMRSSFVFGVLNLLVAIWTCHLFREQHRRPMLTVQAYAVLVLLLAGVAFSEVLLDFSEQGLYRDPVIFARSSRYQRIVVTSGWLRKARAGGPGGRSSRPTRLRPTGLSVGVVCASLALAWLDTP